MERRAVLNDLNNTLFEIKQPKNSEIGVLTKMKYDTPQKFISVKTLKKYEGEWNIFTAGHLLRRATMGYSNDMLKEALTLGLDKTIEKLFESKQVTELPINYNNPLDTAPLGTTWVNEKSRVMNEGLRVNSLLGWWFGLMMNSGINITEKLTLFWHNHFVTEVDTVNEARLSYRYLTLLRDNAIGNFKELAKQITIEPAMLIYLNGDSNTGRAPNENYARELFELFTIGKGPQIADSDYTNYTESDIKSAAKVLTGWVIDRVTGEPSFRRGRHDLTTKSFSYIYNNHKITNNNEEEYKDLIEMIFSHKDSANHICRKIYRWFVNYEITPEVEENIIKPMAKMLKDNNFEIKPVLLTLLESEHFFDVQTIGCQIKNPLEYVVHLYKQTNQNQYEDDYKKKYDFWVNWGVVLGVPQEMFLGDPPSVAGWTSYYQSPSFYQIWINSVTLSFRNSFTDYLILVGIKRGGLNILIDTIKIAKLHSEPENPKSLVQFLVDLMFPIDITENQKAFLKTILVPVGFEDFVWSTAWQELIVNPNDKENANAVEQKLKFLFAVMMVMPEYQLN